MAIFLHSAFRASRVQYISDLHSKFTLRPHHVWKYGRLQSVSTEIRRGKKRRKKEEAEERKKPQDDNIMVCPIPQGDHNQKMEKLKKIVEN